MRLIDADALNIRKYTRWFENVEDARQVERMIREAPTISPPPNAPLTLEQLRELDGAVIVCRKGRGGIRKEAIRDRLERLYRASRTGV